MIILYLYIFNRKVPTTYVRQYQVLLYFIIININILLYYYFSKAIINFNIIIILTTYVFLCYVFTSECLIDVQHNGSTTDISNEMACWLFVCAV